MPHIAHRKASARSTTSTALAPYPPSLRRSTRARREPKWKSETAVGTKVPRGAVARPIDLDIEELATIAGVDTNADAGIDDTDDDDAGFDTLVASIPTHESQDDADALAAALQAPGTQANADALVAEFHAADAPVALPAQAATDLVSVTKRSRNRRILDSILAYRALATGTLSAYEILGLWHCLRVRLVSTQRMVRLLHLHRDNNEYQVDRAVRGLCSNVQTLWTLRWSAPTTPFSSRCSKPCTCTRMTDSTGSPPKIFVTRP